MTFVLQFLDVIYHFYRFAYVKPSLCAVYESYLVQMDDLSDLFLYYIGYYFAEECSIDIHQGYWSIAFFLCCVFIRFCIKVMLA